LILALIRVGGLFGNGGRRTSALFRCATLHDLVESSAAWRTAAFLSDNSQLGMMVQLLVMVL
jgi:hypothetical protein